MKVTVSGPIGSGKSTVAGLLSGLTGFEYISGGDMFRMRARKAGMTVEEYNVYAEQHPEIDRQQDDIILDMLRERDRIVLDSRLSGWLAHRNGIPAFKIFIDAALDERVSRVIKREGGSNGHVRQALLEREESEKKRYLEFYGIDVTDRSIYDLVLETDEMSAEDAASYAFKTIGGKGD